MLHGDPLQPVRVWSVTHLLQQKSPPVVFGQVIRREGALHAGADHYAVKHLSGGHCGEIKH